MDKDKIYLEEIREFCQKVIDFTAGVSYEQFVQDAKLQLAPLLKRICRHIPRPPKADYGVQCKEKLVIPSVDLPKGENC